MNGWDGTVSKLRISDKANVFPASLGQISIPVVFFSRFSYYLFMETCLGLISSFGLSFFGGGNIGLRSDF